LRAVNQLKLRLGINNDIGILVDRGAVVKNVRSGLQKKSHILRDGPLASCPVNKNDPCQGLIYRERE